MASLAHAQDKKKTNATTPAPLPAALAPKADSARPKKPAGITDKVKSSKKSDGLFIVYQDTATGALQLYVKKDQLGKEFIYQSFSLNGPTSLFLNQSMHRANFVFKVQKSFDKLEFARINNSFYYDPNNAVSKTKDVDKPEAVITVEKIMGEDGEGYLVNADALFISEKLDPVKPVMPPSLFSMPMFNLGALNPMKSKIHSIRSFADNTDIVVDLAYDNPMAFVSGGNDITDPRYIRVRMQHSIIEMPKNDFKPRCDVSRVWYYVQ